MLRSNFIILQLDTDYYRATWSEVLGIDSAKIFYGLAPENKLLQMLARIQQSEKVNKYIHPPFKGIWHKRFLSLKFADNQRPLFFVFNSDVLRKSGSFLMNLRRDFPCAKFVVFYTDLMITKSPDVHPNKLRNMVDLLVTFDRKEAEKYSIDYFPTVFSDIIVNEDETIPECDIFYLGSAKYGRLKILKDLYKQCSSAGLKCNFNVTVSKKVKREIPQGIHTIERMSYLDNLKYVNKAKCVLELVQNGAVGSTLRMWEAINYGKAVITNNTDIKNSVYYSDSFVSILNSDNRCDVSFIRNFQPHENSLKKQMIRPVDFLEFIQNKFD
jgi:hypothetical protein